MLAEMRTGSNFLEESLNLLDGLHCHGEAFNPVFVGQHNWSDLFGMDRAARDADPRELMRRIFEKTDGLGGFRFFHDHTPEILETVLHDPRIAKVQLTRNPLDAYVSRKIAARTGQWRLTDEQHRKSARIRFDVDEFLNEHATLQAHRKHVGRVLQTTGQAGFEIGYEQVGDVQVLNGVAAFLGLSDRLAAPSDRLKRQNPAAMQEKVENFDEMQAALSELNLDGLAISETTEPQHGAAVPTFRASRKPPLLFMPIKGGPTNVVLTWMEEVDGAAPIAGFTRKTLRQWKNQNKDARSFTVVSHPAERAYEVFRRYILSAEAGSFSAIRDRLRDGYGLPIPGDTGSARMSMRDRRTAFVGFLEFVRQSNSGQTGMRSDPAFVSQTALLQSLSAVLLPDMVIRSEQLALGMKQLAYQTAESGLPVPRDVAHASRAELAAFYDETVETAVRAAYNRDFRNFGFRRWKP